tara:strand:- start:405 stop:1307 length:903 start_codon:yes stop_codon:yes gene_type:complete
MNEDIYRLLASKGRNGDTKLAHITKEESNILKMLGGAGTTNPWTGLDEYHRIKTFLGKEVQDNPHNKRHRGQKETWPGWHEGKSKEESRIESQQQEDTSEGGALLDPTLEENIDPKTGLPKTAEQLNLGQTVLKAEDYKGMTPEEIVDDIFQKQYNGIVPPGKGTVVEFKAQLAGQLKNMPQFGEADPKKMGFAGEAKELAGRRAESSWDATKYGLQGQVAKVAGAMGSVYGGSGVGMRAGIAGQGAISQGFGVGLESRNIALDTANLGYKEGVYGLEQQAGSDWESGFQSFLDTLPAAA